MELFDDQGGWIYAMQHLCRIYAGSVNDLSESLQNLNRIFVESMAGSVQELWRISAGSMQDLYRIHAGSVQNPSRIIIYAESMQNICSIYAESTQNLCAIYRIVAESMQNRYRIEAAACGIDVETMQDPGRIHTGSMQDLCRI